MLRFFEQTQRLIKLAGMQVTVSFSRQGEHPITWILQMLDRLPQCVSQLAGGGKFPVKEAQIHEAIKAVYQSAAMTELHRDSDDLVKCISEPLPIPHPGII